MTPERLHKIKHVLSMRQPDLTVITDEVHKQRNIAAIVRSCDAVGIDTIHSVMPQHGYQIYSGTSASAEKWVNIKHHHSIEHAVMNLKSRGYQVVAANFSERARDYREIDYCKPTALVMGAEVKGVSKGGQVLCDAEIVLPMLGMVESYNVSVACALILNEAYRQREAAGLYSASRLDDETYNARFLEWGHPKIAEFCNENDIAYPQVGKDGEVENLNSWYAEARALTTQAEV